MFSITGMSVDLSVTIMPVIVSVAVTQLEFSAAHMQVTVSAANMWVFTVIMQVGVSIMQVVFSVVHYAHDSVYCDYAGDFPL